MVTYDLSGKSVIVTGAAGGIGAATTRALVQRGALVTLVDVSQEGLEAVASSLPPDRVLTRVGDVTSSEQMARVTGDAVERFRRVDVVFANAGIAYGQPTSLAAARLDMYERVIEVDLLGVVRTIKPALPEIVRNRGYVLMTSSIYAFFNGALNSGYSASKAGVESLGRALRLELAADGASAGVLYPGWVSTAMTAVVRGENETATRLRERVFRGAMGRFVPPEQVAAAVVAGIEARAARIIEPKIWKPASFLRGPLSAFGDRLVERDREILRLIRQADSEERQRQSARPPTRIAAASEGAVPG